MQRDEGCRLNYSSTDHLTTLSEISFPDYLCACVCVCFCAQLRQLEMQLEQEYEEKLMMVHEKNN